MELPHSQLNISHLKMICTINGCETVKEAAEKLFITQPALTNRIREAERRLQTQLFVRRGRKLIMTTAGKRLLHSATKILEELARAEYDIARLSDGVEQVLRLGLPHYASFKWLPSVVSYFNQHFPHIELEITSDAAKQPLSALYHGEVDIAMFSSAEQTFEADGSDFQSTFILQDELVACLSQEHDKADKAFLMPEDFISETYITNSAVPEKDREYELFFKKHNITPKRVLQVGFNEAIIELVKVNLGLSVFSKQQISPYLSGHQVNAIPLTQEGLHVYWHLVYLNNQDIAKPVLKLIELLKTYGASR